MTQQLNQGALLMAAHALMNERYPEQKHLYNPIPTKGSIAWCEAKAAVVAYLEANQQERGANE